MTHNIHVKVFAYLNSALVYICLVYSLNTIMMMSTKDARAIYSKTFKVVYKDVFFLGQSSFNKSTYNNEQVYSSDISCFCTSPAPRYEKI